MEIKLVKQHDHAEDELIESHPLAFEDVFCDGCGAMLHASNNECMQTWFEIEKWNYCKKCFALMNGVVPVSVGPILTIREALDEDNGSYWSIELVTNDARTNHILLYAASVVKIDYQTLMIDGKKWELPEICGLSFARVDQK